MDGKHQMALGAITLMVICITVLVTIVFIALWPQRTLVAWCLLASLLVTLLVSLLRSINEMSLRRKRYNHHSETPLDREGNPTIVQPGQHPYRTLYAHSLQPHDGEGYKGYGE